jgi:hypothetical protein
MAIEVTPLGILQVPEPDAIVMMQSFPLATAVAVKPETVGAQSAFVKARAEVAVTTEIAEIEETTSARESKYGKERRALRMTEAQLCANLMSTFLGSPNDANNK